MPEEAQEQPELLQPPAGAVEMEAPAEAEIGEAAAQEGDDAAVEAKKDGVQKRIDELTWRAREAERQRDRAWEVLYEKEKAIQTPEIQAAPSVNKPRYEDYDSDSDFQEALVDWKVEEKLQRKEAQRKAEEEKRQRTAEEQKHESWLREARKKFPDFDAVCIRSMDEVPITGIMAEAIKEEDMGAEVAYFLGKNPHEAHRIANLKPTSQAREIGKLAVKLEQTKTKPKTQTSAPASTHPVVGRGAVGKKLEDMTTQEYIDYMNAKEFGASRR